MTITYYSVFDKRKVEGLLDVSEYRSAGMWLRGKFVSDPSVVMELSFDNQEGGLRPLPNTRITYLGIWQGKATLFEYFNGVILNKPTELNFLQYVNPLMVRLGTYRPMLYVR